MSTSASNSASYPARFHRQSQSWVVWSSQYDSWIGLDGHLVVCWSDTHRCWLDSNGNVAEQPVFDNVTQIPQSPPLRLSNTRERGQNYASTGGFDRGISPEWNRAEAHEALIRTTGLGHKFKRRKPEFFQPFKVMRVPWAEPASAPTRDTITSQFGENIHSKIRIFVILNTHEDSCTCLPIHTYGGQGVAKRGVIKSQHGIIHSREHPPEPNINELPRAGEEGMQAPIRVKMRSHGERLDDMSRLNYVKVATVEYNIKVYEVGDVRPEFHGVLIENFRRAYGNLLGDLGPAPNMSRPPPVARPPPAARPPLELHSATALEPPQEVNTDDPFVNMIHNQLVTTTAERLSQQGQVELSSTLLGTDTHHQHEILRSLGVTWCCQPL